MSQNRLSRLAELWWRRRHPDWADPAPGTENPHFQLATRDVPRYLADRATLVARRLTNATPQPWITAEARRLLEAMLRPTDRGLEYGSGGTTTFFASRIAALDSVEAVERWHDALAGRLRDQAVTNVNLHLVSAAQLGYRTPEHKRAYVNVLPDLAPGDLDLVFVDGEYRDACALRAVDLLRPGGLLVLDNSETYLPGPGRSPWQVTRPASQDWEKFVAATSQWRQIWTSNGVWDTTLWVKP